MLYDLELHITYDYDAPVGTGRHLLRVVPPTLGVQHVLEHELRVDPVPAECSTFVDAFGNHTHDVLIRGEHERLDIGLRCRVERFAAALPQDDGPDLADIARQVDAVASLDAQAPHHGLGRSSLVWPHPATTAFARECVTTHGGVVRAVRDIGTALHRAMVFDPGSTTVDTPFDRAFASRRGVCQDFTHIMIACLRGVGIPAGYVSGCLRTTPPPGQPRLTGADAMHAWVRAWCGADIGWLEYDPTNASDVQDDHIVVAMGRDYADVAPTKGVLRTAGSHRGAQSVDLVEVTRE